jgi:hypothetical protein
MGSHRRTRPAVALLAAALALGLAAAVALAAVTVYKNNFSSKAEARELHHSRGKHCGKSWRRKVESVRVKRTGGSGACGYRPPIEGDTDGPDHDFRARLKLLKTTPKGVRRGAYVAIAVRSGRGSGYELRIFPKKHRFQLRRSPSGGGPTFPVTGRNREIKRVNKPNVVRLKAVGGRVTASVNGTRLANVTDPNAGQVGGRKLEVAVGHKRRSRKDVVATFDNLRVAVPNP